MKEKSSIVVKGILVKSSPTMNDFFTSFSKLCRIHSAMSQNTFLRGVDANCSVTGHCASQANKARIFSEHSICKCF